MGKVKDVPVGVKIISVLYYIGAALFVLLGISLLIGSGMVNDLVIEIVGAWLLMVAAIIMLAFGVLGFFIGRGLWKASSWARIVVIIIACLAVLTAVTSLVQGDVSSISSLIINGLIGGYLWFNNNVKKAFA